VESETGAFTANYVDKDVQGQLQPYLAALVEPVARQERIVGVIVAIDGKVESVDVFESTPLFQKLWPRLLKSYALDALSSATQDSDQPAAAACTVAQARAFLETVLAGEVEGTKEHDGGLLVTRRNTSQAMSFSLGGGAMGGGGFGGQPIHAAGFAK
jgi:hypothetical protein